MTTFLALGGLVKRIYHRAETPPVSEIRADCDGPPPAAIGYASEFVLCQSLDAHDWQILWAKDGQSVALIKDGIGH